MPGSILDTFLIVFDGDATKAKLALDGITQASEKTAATVVKNHEEARKKTEENTQHVNRWGRAFTEAGERASEATKKIVENIAEIAAGFAALLGVEKLVEGFFEQAEASQKLGEQAKQLGLNVSMLDAWGQAVRREGGSADSFVQSVQTLTLSLQRMAIGAPLRGKRFFEALGIGDPQHELNNIFELFPKLAEKVKDMPKAQSFAMLRGIGLDEATIRLVQNGGEELDELIKRQKMLGTVTEEDTEVAKKFNIEWMDVKQVLRQVMIEGDTAFLPFLGDILKGVEVFLIFLRDHKDLVVGFFIGLGSAILIATEAMWGLNASFLANPITWVILGVVALAAAFAFLYDDIKAFQAGHNSLIGEMIKKYPLFGEAIDAIAKHWDLLKITFEGFDVFHTKMIMGMIAHWRDWAELIKATLLLTKEAITDPFNAISNFAERTKNMDFGAMMGGDGSSNEKKTTAEQNEVGKQIHDGLVKRGMDSDNAWDFAANAIAESGGVTNRKEMGGGPGRGLFQITSQSRKEDFAKTFGHSVDSATFDEQLDFVMHENQGSEKNSWERIKAIGAELRKKGLSAVSLLWERPLEQMSNAHMRENMRKRLEDVNRNIEAGKNVLASTSSPLMAQTASSLTNRNSSNSLVVSGDTHLHTNSDDPKSFADQFTEHLTRHYNDVMPNYADGISH